MPDLQRRRHGCDASVYNTQSEGELTRGCLLVLHRIRKTIDASHEAIGGIRWTNWTFRAATAVLKVLLDNMIAIASRKMFSDDLVMKIGNQFRVLERTKYGILIEEICDNNTYFIVINLLERFQAFSK